MDQTQEPLNIFEQTANVKPGNTLQSWLIGRPLITADAPNQTIGKLIGLAVFSSDAIASVAYGPQEMMMILALAGAGALHLSVPLAIAIFIFLIILTISYEQTVHAYPGGGGAYIVARDNLGELPAQIAAAALLTDYILTVAVSISSGVAQLISAYPGIASFRVVIAVSMILVIMLINLRGVKESGFTFAIPTYFFLIMMFATIIMGFVRFFSGTLTTVVNPPALNDELIQPLTFFLILRAFANGTTSLTGIEAISNGITAFKEPRSKNAGKTLLWMSGILGVLLLSITFLSTTVGVIPSEGETVISQMARTIFDGRGVLYLILISSTTVILIMSANTAFADFPRLSALTASDGFLPRQLTFRGSRLVYSSGIVLLASLASVLVILFRAKVTGLIPLYAIGVFLSFTLSQAGMVHRWWKSGHLKRGEQLTEPGSVVHYDKGWVHKLVINSFGAFCSFIVVMIFAITKFRDGAWISILMIPFFVIIFYKIHHHYKHMANQLSLDNPRGNSIIKRNRVIMPISGVHNGTLAGLNFAKTLSDDITVVHISIDPVETSKVKSKWEIWGEGYRLVILDSPYRLFLEPLLEYVDKISMILSPNEIITLVVPQFIPKHWWVNILHMRTAETLRKAFLQRKKIAIIEVPYQIE